MAYKFMQRSMQVVKLVYFWAIFFLSSSNIRISIIHCNVQRCLSVNASQRSIRFISAHSIQMDNQMQMEILFVFLLLFHL